MVDSTRDVKTAPHFDGSNAQRKVWANQSRNLFQKIEKCCPEFDREEFISALIWASKHKHKASSHHVNDMFSDPLVLLEHLINTEKKVDRETVLAAILYPSVRPAEGKGVDVEGLADIDAKFPGGVKRLVESTLRLRALDPLPLAEGAEQSLEEYWRQMRLMTLMAVEDPRAILIRTIQRDLYLRAEGSKLDRAFLAANLETTKRLSAPLAEFVGFSATAASLQDITYKLEDPDGYRETQAANRTSAGWEEKAKGQLEDFLQESKYKKGSFEIHVRRKTAASMRTKMRKKNLVNFEQVGDALACRIVFDRGYGAFYKKLIKEFGRESDNTAIKAEFAKLAKIDPHPTSPHMDDRFDDYYKNPKKSGYKAIHDTIFLNIGGRWLPFEIQVLDKKAHLNNTVGSANHENYKLGFTPDNYWNEKTDSVEKIAEGKAKYESDTDAIKVWNENAQDIRAGGNGNFDRLPVYIFGLLNQICSVTLDRTVGGYVRKIMGADAHNVIKGAIVASDDLLTGQPRQEPQPMNYRLKNGERVVRLQQH